MLLNCLSGAFDDDCLQVALDDYISENLDSNKVSELEQAIFGYGDELSDIEEDLIEELREKGTATKSKDSKKPVLVVGSVVMIMRRNDTINSSAGKGKTRIRGIARKRV